MKAPVYLIKWLDHHCDEDWVKLDQMGSPTICQSVGWLVGQGEFKGEPYMRLAHTFDGDKRYGSTWLIFESMILEKYELRFD